MTLPDYEFVGASPVNFTPGRELPIAGTVCHSTVGSLASATSRFIAPNAQRASATFGVGLDGSLIAWVQPWDTAHHCGNWNGNVTRVGIEHEDGGDHADPERTPEQYATSVGLHRALGETYGFPIDREHVGPHWDFSATACPSGFNFERVILEAGGLMDEYVKRSELAAYETDVRTSFDAVKKFLHEHGHGPAAAPRGGARRAGAQLLRIPILEGKPRLQATKRKKATAAQVRAGHGPGRS